jgi:hypothetical protein
LAVDRNKALADYEAAKTNNFMLYFWEHIDEWLENVRILLEQSDELKDIYREQGIATALQTLRRKPDELLSRLTRAGSGEGRP